MFEDRGERNEDPGIFGRGLVRRLNLAMLAAIGAATLVILFIAIAVLGTPT